VDRLLKKAMLTCVEHYSRAARALVLQFFQRPGSALAEVANG